MLGLGPAKRECDPTLSVCRQVIPTFGSGLRAQDLTEQENNIIGCVMPYPPRRTEGLLLKNGID